MLAGEKVDLIFVDINMPDLNGVDFVRADRPPDGDFHHGLFGVRRRGIQARRGGLPAQTVQLRRFQPFGGQGQFALRATPQPTAATGGENPEALPKDKEYISVKADYKVSLVKISDIVYLESEGEYVRMHLADGTTITTLFRLKNMERRFLRSRSCACTVRTSSTCARSRPPRQRAHLPLTTQYVPICVENYKEAFRIYRQEFPKFVAIRPGGDRVPPSTGETARKTDGGRSVIHRKDPETPPAGHTPRRGIRSSPMPQAVGQE